MSEPRPATTLEYARQAPPDEVDLILLEAHAAQEIRGELEPRHGASSDTVNALYGVSFGLGAGIRQGHIGDGVIRAEQPSTGKRILGRAILIAGVVCAVAGIFGFAAFMTGGDFYPNPGQSVATREMDLSTQIVIAMVCFWIACVYPVVTIIDWLRKRRLREHVNWGSQLLIIPFAVGTLAALNARDVPVGEFWLAPVLPVWLALVLSMLTFLTTLLGSRPPTEEEQQRRIVFVRKQDPEKFAEDWTELPEPVREQLIVKRNAGLRVLAERGLIVDLDAEIARPFGAGVQEGWRSC